MAEEAQRATAGKTKSNGPILVEFRQGTNGQSNPPTLRWDDAVPVHTYCTLIYPYTQAPYVMLAVYGTHRWGVARPLERRSGPLADGSFNGIEVKLP